MSITITTVERIGEVAANPAPVANSGFLYTKDVAGVTELFYEADDGTVTQLTPMGTPSPWTRSAPDVYLNVTTDKVSIGASSAPAGVSLYVTNSDTYGIRVRNAPAGALVLEALKTGEAVVRYKLVTDGTMTWSDGTAAADVRIARSGTSELTFDDGAGGGAYLLTPDGNGTVGYFDGVANVRWDAMVAARFQVANAPGAANVSAQIDDSGAGGELLLGAGGATAVDARVRRTAATTITIDDNAGGGILVNPPAFGTGSLGDFNGAANKTWANVAGSNLYVVDNAGDANASAVLTGPGTLRLGAGGATALDTRIARTAAKTLTVDDNAGGAVDVIPAVDYSSNVGSKIGTAARRFAQVNAFEVNTGDIVFTDPGCAVCGRPFEEGDELVMLVTKIHDEPTGRRTRTVPAHHGCRQ